MARYYRREFLNPKTGPSVIEATDHNLYITDCEGKIHLDFGAWNGTDEKSLQELEQKIDMLYDVVKEFRTHVKRRIRVRRKENAAREE
jgi:hypothetical protein